MPWWTLALALAAPGDFVEPEAALIWDARRPSGGQFGWAVSAIADLDGDGATDVLTSDPFANGNAGQVTVLSGRDGSVLHTFEGAAGDQLGYAIADAGDLDGDGVHDVFAGAARAGTATVWSGADGAVLLTLSGGEAGDTFGAAVSGAGDLDGDGTPDLFVGAELSDVAAADAGRVAAYSGATGAELWTVPGTEAGDMFGSGTGPVGDVDGDGVPDLVVGARNAGPLDSGQVQVLSGADGSVVHTFEDGSATGSLGTFFVGGVGDVDGDGVDDVFGGDFSHDGTGANSGRAWVWSGASGSVLHQLDGSAAGEGLGTGRGAGDLDGDGVPDLSVGSWTSSIGAPTAGQITVFSGADGSVLRTVTSLSDGENFGFDVVGVGDVNGDGANDLVASAATRNRVYLIAGVPHPTVDTGTEDPPDDGKGCGCDGTGGGAVAWLPLILLALRRRSVQGHGQRLLDTEIESDCTDWTQTMAS